MGFAVSSPDKVCMFLHFYTVHGDMHDREGACLLGGGCMTEETATAVDSTHPTEMHSCYSNWMIHVKQATNFWTTTLEKSLKNIKSRFLMM